MNIQYKLSPVIGEERLQIAYEYIADQLEALSIKVFNERLPITTLKVFPHFKDEYEALRKIISDRGEPAPFNSATSIYTKCHERIQGNDIKYIGVRIVDVERPQVGCGDFEVDDFDEIRNKYADTSNFVRSFRKDMLEVWHPDFDVLGYIIPKNNL